jgi:hypothetical protein
MKRGIRRRAGRVRKEGREGGKVLAGKREKGKEGKKKDEPV